MFTCVLADAQNEGRVLRTRRADMFKFLRAHRRNDLAFSRRGTLKRVRPDDLDHHQNYHNVKSYVLPL